jgi:hypothetical protein
VAEEFTLRAKIEREETERRIRRESNLQAGLAYPIDLHFSNRPPQIRLMSASSGGKRVQLATPGGAIVVKSGGRRQRTRPTGISLDVTGRNQRWAHDEL